MQVQEETVAVYADDDPYTNNGSSRNSRSRRPRSPRRSPEQDQAKLEAQAERRTASAKPQRNGQHDAQRAAKSPAGRKQARPRNHESTDPARDYERPTTGKRLREASDDEYRGYTPDEQAPRRPRRSRTEPRNPDETQGHDEAYRSYAPDEDAPRRPRRSRAEPRNPDETQGHDEAYRSYAPDEQAPRRPRRSRYAPEPQAETQSRDEAYRSYAPDEQAPRRPRRSRYEPRNAEARTQTPPDAEAQRRDESGENQSRRSRRSRYAPRNPDATSDDQGYRGYQADEGSTRPPRRSRYAPRNPADGTEGPSGEREQRSYKPNEGAPRRPRRSRYEARTPDEHAERQRSSEDAPPNEAGERPPRPSRRGRGPGRTYQAATEATPSAHEEPHDEPHGLDGDGYEPKRRRVRRRRRRSKKPDQQLLGGEQHGAAFEAHESRTLLRPRPRSAFRPRAAADSHHFFSQPGEFGESWWAQRWVSVLESFGLGSRLSRGRGYARGGSVLSIEISEGRIVGRVQGSRSLPYKVTISVIPLSNAQWERAIDAMADQAIFTARLLANEMPREIEQIFSGAGVALFPQSVYDLQTSCTCPDFATPCKHAAAVYYQLGEYLDRDPFLIFALRGRGKERIIQSLRARRADTANSDGAADEVQGRVPSLEEQLQQFDEIGPELEQITPHIVAPTVASTMLRRYGPSPADTTMELHELYLLMSRATLERLFAHE
ncbi:SWIM zinc finger family protein [Candidatus Viridilinea mediisalina]|nr:SWIM zinc finger family protein [Candidatus Viridilinea mediisalina]